MDWLILLAAVATPPAPPVAPYGPRGVVKVSTETVTSTTCDPNGKFLIELKWELHKAVTTARIEQNGKPLPSQEVHKLIDALKNASDILYLELGCSGTRDAQVNITYADISINHGAVMRLVTTIRPDKLELLPPTPVGR